MNRHVPEPEAQVEASPIPPIADYLPVPTGQVHRLRSWPAAGLGKPPLYALHATAYSGRTFSALMSALPERRVAALDAPGYGSSTRPAGRLSVEGYAEVLLQAIEAANESCVDLLGYHTGALFALQMAALRPDLIRRLVLIGVPFYPSGPKRDERLRTLGAPMRLSDDLSQFEERWRFFVTQRPSGISLQQGYRHFVDELRAYPYGFWAHEAAFSFDAEPVLRATTHPVLVLSSANHLAEPSHRAAALMANAVMRDLDGPAHQVLEANVAAIASEITDFLGR